MHRLHRDPLAPAGLRRYQYGRDTWSMQSPTSAERGEIWAKLDAMQGSRCAYCEAEISEGDRHIEHFRQRSRYPQGTFDWSNLFGSCGRDGICGRHKDQCGPYPHTDLIKPDVDDPDEFLMFDPQGGVHPKAGLPAGKQHRAQETIRILNLSGGGLPHMRKAAACGYVQLVEQWAAYASEFPEEEWRPIVEQELAQELANTVHLPFATAIRHTLTRVGP
jgi:uncharacterized protein (TIGR02646 family)